MNHWFYNHSILWVHSFWYS